MVLIRGIREGFLVEVIYELSYEGWIGIGIK